jgi:hypothetical protein
MGSKVVYQNLVPVAVVNSDGIFAGKTFWLSRAVPQRPRYVEGIKVLSGSSCVFIDGADVVRPV